MKLEQIEQFGTIALGSLMLSRARRRCGISGSLFMLTGGLLLYRGIRAALRDISQDSLRPLPARPTSPVSSAMPSPPITERPLDVVDEASEESFPASDAPGWIQRRS